MSRLSAPLTITFRRARAAGACVSSYRRMAEHVGGVKTFGEDAPLLVEEVLDVCGLDDALWALDAIGAHRVLRLWACDCAERVLPIFERAHPGDRRPREAIRVSRLHARGLATEAALAAARDAAARDAAERASAWDAAGYAADAAALSAAAGASAWDTAQFAVDAAGYAADAAALSAAAGVPPQGSAAWDAAWDAEEAWQIERLRVYLRGEA